MNEIIIASNNKGKIKEVGEILNSYKIISMQEARRNIDVEEDKTTFSGNAIKKAEEIAKALRRKIVLSR